MQKFPDYPRDTLTESAFSGDAQNPRRAGDVPPVQAAFLHCLFAKCPWSSFLPANTCLAHAPPSAGIIFLEYKSYHITLIL